MSSAQMIAESAPQKEGLRAQALRGGAFIVVRQGVGMVLSLATVLFVTRVIGPREYGFFAAAFGIAGFLSSIGTWGVDVFLLRKPEVPLRKDYNQAFTLLLTLGAMFAALLIFGRGIIAGRLHLAKVGPLLIVLAVWVLLNLLNLPGVVQLDRELRFKRVASNELIAQLAGCIVAITSAFRGLGAWAPAMGITVQAFALLVLTYVSVRYAPAIAWDTRAVREMLSYGLSYSSSIWVWQMRSLVNPIVVGYFAGAEAVGLVALGIRMAEVLSFAKSATWRVAMAAFAKISSDRDKVCRSIEEGMRLQALSVGLPLAGFALLAPVVIPLGFGPKWAPSLHVFAFIALGALTNSMFNLHSSVLYLYRKNISVTLFHLVHVAIFATAAALFVCKFGFIGYGYAEVAALCSYVVIHEQIVRVVNRPRYAGASMWFLITAMAILSCLGPAPLRIGAALMMLLPFLLHKERAVLRNYGAILLSRGAA
jgi:O-antigen/teichoic acid export membrane protein